MPESAMVSSYHLCNLMQRMILVEAEHFHSFHQPGSITGWRSWDFPHTHTFELEHKCSNQILFVRIILNALMISGEICLLDNIAIFAIL